MSPPPKRRFWRTCRLCFRGFRITVWLLLLLAVATLAYLNQVGLPGFVKRPLLDGLRARGLDIHFSRLRLRWYTGIVAENVRFDRADEPLSPHFTAAEVRLELNHHALMQGRLQVDTLVIRKGRLEMPLADTNQSNRLLTVDDIQTDLRLPPDDRWELDDFTARFAGAHIRLAGTVENASAVEQWKLFKEGQPAAAGVWQRRLRRLADILEHTHFDAAPELMLRVWGDAKDIESFQARLVLRAPGAETPWGTFHHGLIAARVLPGNSNDLARAQLRLEAGAAETEWASVTNLQIYLEAVSAVANPGLVTADLSLLASQAETRWGSASNARFTAHWIHSLTNAVPISGEGQLLSDSVQTEWGTAETIDLTGHLVTHGPSSPQLADDSWAWWAKLEPYSVDWSCRLTGLRSPRLEAKELAAAGNWRAPSLDVTNIHAVFDASTGQDSAPQKLDASASLNVQSRDLNVKLASNTDPYRFYSFFTPVLRHWISQYSWVEPPELEATVSLALPSWTNRLYAVAASPGTASDAARPDFGALVRPTLHIAGQFNITRGAAFRGIPASTACSHFVYSNFAWHLPDLFVTRPEGWVEAAHDSDDISKDFYFKLRSTIDPKCLYPLLDSNARRDLDVFVFTQPPYIEGEIRGRWNDASRITFTGSVGLTNFAFKSEPVESFESGVQYSNRVVLLTEARLDRARKAGPQQQPLEMPEHLSADALAVDLAAQRIYITNGFGRMDVQAFTKTIGSQVAHTMEPYRFDHPPTVRASGLIPMRGDDDADLHFDVQGGPFHWFRFNLPRIAGHIRWTGDRLALTNVTADFYGGKASGSASFYFGGDEGTDFQFDLNATDSQLQRLMADVSTVSNRLEGTLTASLHVTKASSDNWRSWQGYGQVDLRDGLIWAIPIFGIFSPVLDSVAPGLGSSRATDGFGHFVITNGVIVSNDLEIRSPAMRLAYRGDVDLQAHVKARVEAELLRDMWLIGPVVSSVFWPVEKLFEYKVTGSLSQPKTEPVYFLPKLVLMPFHPIRTIKGLFPEETSTPPPINAPPSTYLPPSTNAPPSQP